MNERASDPIDCKSHKAARRVKNAWRSAYVVGVLLAAFLFSPPLAHFLSLSFLIVVAAYRVDVPRGAIVGIQIVALMSTVVAAASHPLFLYQESDFTTYYANYLKFLDNGFQLEFLEFAFGLEAGVPLLNYLFSLVIQGPFPYLVKALHASLQLSLLMVLYAKVLEKISRNEAEGVLLFVLMLVFFKYGATLNHLPQGYSSLVLLIALYTETPWIRRLLICIATFFHLTTLLIYPLIRFLMIRGSRRQLRLFALAMPLIGLSIFLLLDFLTSTIASNPAVWLTKFRWAFTNVLSTDMVVLSLKRSLTASAYLVLLLTFGLAYRIWSQRWPKSTSRLVAILVFILSFGWLPGLSIRVLAAVLTVLMGAIYFDFLVRRASLRQAPLITFCLLLFFNVNWTVNSPLYYYTVPLANNLPFYFVEPFGMIVTNVERNTLPSEKNIVLRNPYR